ncbi:MAG: hypothetical protein KJN78_06090 [Gammaproteobacteria bacterium]|nr:hypothetical protein [Gammaproteobacteria bacterium]NNJ80348.1 hypothetical protein [Xanthomonadales bacterium]
MRFSTGARGDTAWRRVFPFRRSWPAIIGLLVFDVIFLIPAITTFREMGSFGAIDSLFDLVGVVFLGAWLLGWSMAPLLLTALVLLLAFGREELWVRPGKAELFIGLPFAGFAADYDVARMRNLRLVQPPAKSGTSWRGQHLSFDYGAQTIGFGSNIGPLEQGEVESGIEMSSGAKIRKGEVAEEELEPEWETVPEAAAMAVDSSQLVANEPKSWFTPSVLMLIVANLVPVAGTVFFGWRLSDVMVLYWAESAIIGFFNLFKIIAIGRWGGVFAGLFFLGHFGGFMAVHFLFVYTLFVEGLDGAGPSGDLGAVWALFAGLWPALLALAVSHAYSFFVNFLGREEHRQLSVRDQMSDPYGRIIFMHMVLIFGGGLAMVLGEPTFVLLGVIALKVVFDIRAHLKQHRRANPASARR